MTPYNNPTTFMKTSQRPLLVSALSLSVLLISGCTLQPRTAPVQHTPPSPYPARASSGPLPGHQNTGTLSQDRVRLAALQQELEERNELERRNTARMDALARSNEDLRREMNTMRAGTTAGPSTADLQRINGRIDHLENLIRKVDEQRLADNKANLTKWTTILKEELAKNRSATTSAAPRTTQRNNTAPPAGTPSEYYHEHTVQPGETLSAIAKAYGTSVKGIMIQNNMSNADVIKPRQVLHIPAQP